MRDFMFFSAGVFVAVLFAVMGRWARTDKTDALRDEAADEMRRARALAAACGIAILGDEGGPDPTVPVPDKVEDDVAPDADAEPAVVGHHAHAASRSWTGTHRRKRRRFRVVVLGWKIAAREPFDIGDAWINDPPAPDVAPVDFDAEMAALTNAEQVLA